MENPKDISEDFQENADNQSVVSEDNQIAETKAFLKIKFNHEELDLDEKTTRELAQKGLNYDKVKEKLRELESIKEKEIPDEQIKLLENQVSVLENELKKERENRVNEVSCASPVSGFGAVFDDGLFTEEQLNTMSGADIKKNLDKALRSMSFISKNKLR